MYTSDDNDEFSESGFSTIEVDGHTAIPILQLHAFLSEFCAEIDPVDEWISYHLELLEPGEDFGYIDSVEEIEGREKVAAGGLNLLGYFVFAAALEKMRHNTSDLAEQTLLSFLYDDLAGSSVKGSTLGRWRASY